MRGASGLAVLAALLAGSLAPGNGAESAERYIVSFAHPLTDAERLEFGVLSSDARHVSVIPAAHAQLTPAQKAVLASRPYVIRIDPEAPLEWHLDRALPVGRAGPPAWALGVSGRGVTVAIVDSGIDTAHPDFDCVLANVRFVAGGWQPSLADTDGHGTHVAGIVAGTGQQSADRYRGVAPGACLVGMDFSGSFTTTAALSAFDWIEDNRQRHNIRIVSNSWGRAEEDATYDPGDPVQRASSRLVQEGLTLVFSAANNGPGPRTLSAEAQNPDVITVGAVDDAAVIARYSSRGPAVDVRGRELDAIKPDVVAPGSLITSAKSSQATATPSPPGIGGVRPTQAEGAFYTELSGTSQASPYVAGIVALMLEENPSLTPAQTKNLLREASIDLGPAGPDLDHGFGLVDARDAVLLASGAEEDNGNILIAGGQERYQVEGSVSAAGGTLVQTSPLVQLGPGGTIQAPFPLKPGATRLTFDFGWSAPTASFQIFLSDGVSTFGPWTSAEIQGATRVISGLKQEGLSPGIWYLIARPLNAVDTDYAIVLDVLLREQPELAARLDPRYREEDRAYGPVEQLANQLGNELERVAFELRKVPGPEGVVALLAVVGVAGTLRRRGR